MRFAPVVAALMTSTTLAGSPPSEIKDGVGAPEDAAVDADHDDEQGGADEAFAQKAPPTTPRSDDVSTEHGVAEAPSAHAAKSGFLSGPTAAASEGGAPSGPTAASLAARPTASAKDDIHFEIGLGYAAMDAMLGSRGYYVQGPRLGLVVHAIHRGPRKLLIGGGGGPQLRAGYIVESERSGGDSGRHHTLMMVGDFLFGGAGRSFMAFGTASLGAGQSLFSISNTRGTYRQGVSLTFSASVGAGALGVVSRRVRLGARGDVSVLGSIFRYSQPRTVLGFGGMFSVVILLD